MDAKKTQGTYLLFADSDRDLKKLNTESVGGGRLYK
jgi:hypothetical protein